MIRIPTLQCLSLSIAGDEPGKDSRLPGSDRGTTENCSGSIQGCARGVPKYPETAIMWNCFYLWEFDNRMPPRVSRSGIPSFGSPADSSAYLKGGESIVGDDHAMRCSAADTGAHAPAPKGLVGQTIQSFRNSGLNQEAKTFGRAMEVSGPQRTGAGCAGGRT